MLKTRHHKYPKQLANVLVEQNLLAYTVRQECIAQLSRVAPWKQKFRDICDQPNRFQDKASTSSHPKTRNQPRSLPTPPTTSAIPQKRAEESPYWRRFHILVMSPLSEVNFSGLSLREFAKHWINFKVHPGQVPFRNSLGCNRAAQCPLTLSRPSPPPR